MSEQSELASAIRENTGAIRDLRRSINTLTDRVDKLDSTMERVHVRLASKLDAGEMMEFVESTNRRVKRIEQHLELA